MITEDYVSFEVAKLLKEKGFDCVCKVWYAEYTSQFGGEKYSTIQFDNHNKFNENYKFICYVPTLQMVMKWLREVHSIFIGISVCERYENKTDAETKVMFFFELLNLKEKQLIDGYSQEYVHTYEEACEEAIKYCLENLI